MYLRDLLDISEYNEMVDEGYISVRKHAELDLFVSNYTPKTQYESKWNPSTMACRGLITDAQDRVIARPWNKFFNLGERNLDIQFDQPVEVMDKLDGSLGILYQSRSEAAGAEYSIATRGSFHSDQAEHATEVWKRKYWQLNSSLWQPGIREYTFLFEIVYPENRIVLDYGSMDDLVLLGAVHTEYGYYLGAKQAQEVLGYTGPVAEVFPLNSISEALDFTDRANAEGFVIRTGNHLVKIKQPDYIDMHRLRFELTEKRVWENLSMGKDIRSIVEPLPDEFQKDIIAMATALETQYLGLKADIMEEYKSIVSMSPSSRAEFAQHAVRSKHKAALFTLYDHGMINQYIWNAIKPRMVV